MTAGRSHVPEFGKRIAACRRWIRERARQTMSAGRRCFTSARRTSRVWGPLALRGVAYIWEMYNRSEPN